MVEIIFLAFAFYGFGFCTGYVVGLLVPKKIPKDKGGKTDESKKTNAW